MKGHAGRPALDEFQIDDSAGLIQLGDEPVVVAVAGAAVLVRDEVGARRRVHDEAGGILQAGHLEGQGPRARKERQEQRREEGPRDSGQWRHARTLLRFLDSKQEALLFCATPLKRKKLSLFGRNRWRHDSSTARHCRRQSGTRSPRMRRRFWPSQGSNRGSRRSWWAT